MKKILFINGGFGSGGAEHQSAQLINMLIEEGYDVTVASFGDIPDHYYVSPLTKRVQLAPHKSTIKKIIAIECFLLKTDADVVFAFSQRLSCLTLFPMLLKPRVVVISSERNYTISTPDKYEKILTKTGIYRRADHIVPNNFSQGRYLAKKMPSIAHKIKVITNYTEVDTYKPTPLPHNAIPNVGIFCRFELQKNFHRFIDMLGVLKQRNAPKFHVDWYGNHQFTTQAQNEYFEEGLKRIKEYGVEDFITIHEPTREVAKLIPTFDVMCLPSLHEGFSNSISEYICCGRPVICSDVSDNSVMVHDGENGFLFNPLDVENMCDVFMKYLTSSTSARNQMAIKSREIAEGLFSKSKFLSSYIKLIENEK